MPTTRIDSINAALLRIGSEPLQSEVAAGAQIHLAVWDTQVASLLAVYPWSFQTVVRKLARLAAAPQRYWAFQFELPPDMAGVPRALYASADSRVPCTDWEIVDGTLQTNQPEVWLKHDRKPDPATWPGWFCEIVVVAVMAELSLSIREDPVLRERLRGDLYGPAQMMGLGGMVGQARALDSSGKPSPVLGMGRNPLAEARFQR
jgi:hypothetical protein